MANKKDCKESILKTLLFKKIGFVSNQEFAFAIKQVSANRKCYTKRIEVTISDIKQLITTIVIYRKLRTKNGRRTQGVARGT